MSYKGGQTLRNDQYRDFVLRHVLRPYQTMIAPEGKISTRDYYERIPELSKNNPDWWECVMDRLSRCFSKIEYGVLDLDSATGRCIFDGLSAKGVQFFVPKRRAAK